MTDKTIAIYNQAPKTKYLIGSGFYLANGIIITAEHVIKQNGKIISKIFGSTLIKDKPIPIELEFIKSIENTDISILKIKNSLQKDKPPFFNIGNEYYSGDEVLMCGFPGAFSDRQNRPIPSSFPMIRKGIISSLYESIENTKILILDMIGVKGFSGSPIVHQNTKKVIAVFSQMPGRNNTGFSIAYPIKKEYINGVV